MRWGVVVGGLLSVGLARAEFLTPGGRARPNLRYTGRPSAAYMYVPGGDANANLQAASSSLLTANQATCQTFIPTFTLTGITKMVWRVILSQAASNCSLCIYDGATAGVPRLHTPYTAPACTTNSQDRSITGLGPFTLVAGKKYTACMISQAGISVASSPVMPTFVNVFVTNAYTAVTTSTSGACPATLPAISASNTMGAFVGMVSAE